MCRSSYCIAAILNYLQCSALWFPELIHQSWWPHMSHAICKNSVRHAQVRKQNYANTQKIA